MRLLSMLLLCGWLAACSPSPQVNLPASRIVSSSQPASSPSPVLTVTAEPTPEPIFESYVVQPGDGLFTIADEFRLRPETILFCNIDVLGGNPHALQAGMTLRIPPDDGVLHRWREGDTLQDVARAYRSSMVEMFKWPGNRRYLTREGFHPSTGNWVFVPGGEMQFEGMFEPRIEEGG